MPTVTPLDMTQFWIGSQPEGIRCAADPADCQGPIDTGFYRREGHPLDGDWYHGGFKVRVRYPVISRLDMRFVIESWANDDDADMGALPV